MMRALCVLLTLGGLMTGCGSRPIVSQGHTRFLSDRACEIDATVRGLRSTPGGAGGLAVPLGAPGEPGLSSPLVALSQRAARLARAGEPLFLEQARITFTTESSLACEAHVESFARLGPGQLYRDEPDVSFRWPPAEAAAAAPRYAALVVGGVLRVGTAFGQMRPDDAVPTADDEGRWSAQALDEALRQEGYRLEPDALTGGTVWRRSFGELVVEVERLGPDVFPFVGADESGAGRLRALIGRSSIVYVNGHARRPAFAPLDEPSSYLPARSRLLVLDQCWSYFDHARPVLDAAGDAQVVTTDGRVVTGSVESFVGLLGGLVAGAARPSTGARWLTLLGAMNDAAAVRSQRRSGQVEARMKDPEVYGVSPAW